MIQWEQHFGKLALTSQNSNFLTVKNQYISRSEDKTLKKVIFLVILVMA